MPLHPFGRLPAILPIPLDRVSTKQDWEMTRRLEGKRAVVTDSGEYNGTDIAALFREEGADVIADTRDLTRPGAAEDLIREAGHVDILFANLARPYEFVPAVEQPDEEMTRLMEAIFYPLHRLVRAVLPQMLERKRGKIVVVGSTAGIKGRSGGSWRRSPARRWRASSAARSWPCCSRNSAGR
jgi:NAD(P)-dependent dehydrogenase (short-subunit alcohol dehydrogenase family)